MKYKYVIYSVFVASGISGLMYEVVWLRMLSRITGVTLYATSTVLASFMAGLALGSFLLGRLADKREDGLRIYALLELMIGCTALLIPVFFAALIPLYQYVYQATGENALITAIVRSATLFLSLLIPTTIMGGTLPILTSCLVKRESLFGKNLSLLYGLNTLGAVIGVLLSGFLTIGWLGEQGTVYLGLAINLFVAATAYGLYRVDRRTARTVAAPGASHGITASKLISPYSDGVRAAVLVVFAASGFTALAYEVIWTRQLILFLMTSVYSFSGMLAVFLCGIALGSMAVSGRVEKLARPVGFFAFLELIVGLLSVVNLHLFPLLDSLHPSSINSTSVGQLLLCGVVSTVVLVFPITFVFGAIFPVAALCYAKETGKAGSSVGSLYSANTVGSIFGSLAAGFLLVPAIGSTHTVILLACLNVFLGLVLMGLEFGKFAVRKLAYVAVALLFVVAAIGASGKDPFLATVEGRVFDERTASGAGHSPAPWTAEIYFHKEGIEGSVTAFRQRGKKMLWINGVGMTELCTETKLLSHLPLMFAKNPREVLIICFGMGTTIRSTAIHYPDLNVTAVDLVPETFETFKYYHADADQIKKMRNVHLITNDGRNTLLLSNKKYDVISVDPAPPIWSAGTVNLYSLEFFELCKSRLTSDGVMCLWFPGKYVGEDTPAVIRTFSEIFENTTVWKGPRNVGCYLIGTMREVSKQEFKDNMNRAFKQPAIHSDLVEYDTTCASPSQLYNLLWLDKSSVRAFTAHSALISDNHPFTEFFLWRRVRERFAGH